MNKTILLADDDPAVRRMLQRVLTEENYTVLVAGNEIEALDLCRGAEVDLVLLDLNFSRSNGSHRLPPFTRPGRSLPLIVLSEQANPVVPEWLRSGGLLMEKPVDLENLLKNIRELLNAQPAHPASPRNR